MPPDVEFGGKSFSGGADDGVFPVVMRFFP